MVLFFICKQNFNTILIKLFVRVNVKTFNLFFKDPHQYKSLTQSGIQLHEICFTVVCGCNLVNITYYNFIAVESNPTVVLSVRFRTSYLIKNKFVKIIVVDLLFIC